MNTFSFDRLVRLAGSRNTVHQWDLVTATPYVGTELVMPQVTGVCTSQGAFSPQTVSAFNPESPNYLLVPAAELQLPEFNAIKLPASAAAWRGRRNDGPRVHAWV